MKKFLPEHRRQLADFEVVDMSDPDEIAALRAHTEPKVPLRAHWTWEYGSEVQELRALYEKGKLNQWNAATDLDWEVPVSTDEFVLNPQASLLAQACALMGKDEETQREAAFDELGHLLSQLLHGEQAALQLCGQLTNVCDKMDQKWYAASQVIDEARHIEVISRFLESKIGTIHPISPTLKVLLDELLSAEGPQRKTLGMQTLFEGTAVGIMDTLRSESRNPLLTEMLRRVEQDESRHAAFGVLTMRRVVAQASPTEMADMEDWAFSILETLNANQNLDMLHVLGPKYDIDPDMITTALVNLPNHAEINSIVFMHTVVPNLRRLGLITERTEQGWRDVGLMVDERGGQGAAAVALA